MVRLGKHERLILRAIDGAPGMMRRLPAGPSPSALATELLEQ